MSDEPTDRLLGTDDAPPVRIINPKGTSSFLLIGDHAGNAIPKRLGALGLEASERVRHIAWDIGIGTLGAMLAETLDAVFVRQTYSRLVVDCNRRFAAVDAIAAVSDGTVVPGNADLSDADRKARFAEIHEPYQAAIADEIVRRDAAGQATILVSLHSFTPSMRGFVRPWEVGILHDAGNTDFSHTMLASLRAEGDLTVGDNEPYRMDQIDYTIPRHAYPAGRPYVEIEVRQDLIGDEAGCAAWCARLVRVLGRVLGRANPASVRAE